MPPPTLQVTLDPDVQAELERRYHTTRDATTRTRYQIVLLNAQGHTPPQIAQLVRSSADTVRRVLNRYLAGGADAVPHRPHPGQPPHYPPGWEQELVRVADLDPHEVGVDSALWTCRLLADYLQGVTGHRAGIETVRIALHRAGFVCKRPRWVLTRKAQAQPGGQKTREGGGTPGCRRSTGASTRMRLGPRRDPGRRPVPRGSAPPARAAGPRGPVPARRGRGRVALSRPGFVGGYDALASGLIIVWSCPISQSFSYSAGGIFPQAEWSLSLLYQDTHSAVATVTSPASCHGPSRLISSFLYREFTASAAALS